jgi:hypothetical protein
LGELGRGKENMRIKSQEKLVLSMCRYVQYSKSISFKIWVAHGEGALGDMIRLGR